MSTIRNPSPATVTITKRTHVNYHPHSHFKAIWKSCYRTDWKGPLKVSNSTLWLSEGQPQNYTRLLKALDNKVLKTVRVEMPDPLWAPIPVLSHSSGAAAIHPCI